MRRARSSPRISPPRGVGGSAILRGRGVPRRTEAPGRRGARPAEPGHRRAAAQRPSDRAAARGRRATSDAGVANSTSCSRSRRRSGASRPVLVQQLRFTDFRADSRLKKLRDLEVFDHVVLNFAAKTGTRVTIAKDFPPDIEKLEARLHQGGAHYDSEAMRNPENGRLQRSATAARRFPRQRAHRAGARLGAPRSNRTISTASRR